MKILRFNDDRIGVLNAAGAVVDISDLISHRDIRGPQGTMEELIGRFPVYRPAIERLCDAQAGQPLVGLRLLAPLARPSRVLAAYGGYDDRNVPLEFFHKAPELVGPGADIRLPDVPAITGFNAEAELAFVIASPCKDVAERAAMEHVFGYVPFFDVSARGLTRRSQLLPKGQDGFATCGPWITTVDEIPDLAALTVTSWVNGQPNQDYPTRRMSHSVASQVAWLSRFIRLRPGDLVATGTFHEGLGDLNPGDRLEIEITNLGRAAFPVVGDGPRKTRKGPGGGAPAASGGFDRDAMTKV